MPSRATQQEKEDQISIETQKLLAQPKDWSMLT